MRVFVSYRRNDTGGRAGRLCDSLATHLDPHHVFHDVRSIAPGHDFDAEIRQAIDASDVALVVIGREWTTVADGSGNRRLDDPADYVVREVAAALDAGKVVVPVIVDAAPMPDAVELPATIAGLAARQATTVRDQRAGTKTSRPFSNGCVATTDASRSGDAVSWSAASA